MASMTWITYQPLARQRENRVEGKGELWCSSDDALAEPMVDSGAYVAITVVPGALTTPIGCSSSKKGLPLGEAACRALAGSCL